jgi:hypothetical protein
MASKRTREGFLRENLGDELVETGAVPLAEEEEVEEGDEDGGDDEDDKAKPVNPATEAAKKTTKDEWLIFACILDTHRAVRSEEELKPGLRPIDHTPLPPASASGSGGGARGGGGRGVACRRTKKAPTGAGRGGQ